MPQRPGVSSISQFLSQISLTQQRITDVFETNASGGMDVKGLLDMKNNNITNVGTLSYTALDPPLGDTPNLTAHLTNFANPHAVTPTQLGLDDGLASLTTAEVSQLQNIDTVTISNQQWGWLGDLNQNVATGSNVSYTNITSTGVFQAANGAINLPSYTFASDTDTGFFSDGAGRIGVCTQGSYHAVFTTSELDMKNNNITNVGTLSYTALDPPPVAIASLATNADNAIARFDGVDSKTIQGSSITINDAGSITVPNGQQFLGGAGTGVKPTYSFSNDPDTGLRGDSNSLYLCCEQNDCYKFRFDSIEPVEPLNDQNLGSDTYKWYNLYYKGQTIASAVTGEASPAYSFNGSLTTGMYQPFGYTDTIGFSTAGVERMRITSTGVIQPGATGTQDLGTSSLRFKDIYSNGNITTAGLIDVANASNSIAFDTDEIKMQSTALTWNGNSVGDTIAPATNADNAIARFDGVDSKTIQSSGVSINANDQIVGIAGTNLTPSITFGNLTAGLRGGNNRVYIVCDQEDIAYFSAFGNFRPQLDEFQTIGTDLNRWGSLYLNDNVYLNGSIVSSGSKLSCNPPEEMITPVLTADDSNPNFLVDASSINSTPFAAWKAFDGNYKTTRWLSGNVFITSSEFPNSTDTFLGNNGPWVRVDLNEDKFVSTFKINVLNSSASPRDFTIYGSLDGHTWEAIHTEIDYPADTTVTMDRPAYVKHLVLHITRKNGTSADYVTITGIVYGIAEVKTPVLTVNIHPNFLVSASSQISTSFEPWRAVNGVVSAAERWISATGSYGVSTSAGLPSLDAPAPAGNFIESLGGVGGSWHKTSFTRQTYITSYRLQWSISTTATPNAWVILVSNDDTNWTQVGSGVRSGVLDTGVLNLDLPITCEYIAVVVTSNGGADNTFINEITYSANPPTLYIPSDISFSQPIGELYVENNATVTTISISPGWFKVSATTTSNADNNHFTGTSNRLTYTGSDTKIMQVGATITFRPSSSGIKNWAFGIHYNGAYQTGSQVKFRSSSSTEFYTTVIHTFVKMSSNGFIELYVQNLTDTTNVIITDMNLFAVATGPSF